MRFRRAIRNCGRSRSTCFRPGKAVGSLLLRQSSESRPRILQCAEFTGGFRSLRRQAITESGMSTRAEGLARLEDTKDGELDLLIVGGGATGLGIAVDA